jgi:hypothetical protein
MKPYETFDIDLREGKAREDAFVYVFLKARVEHKRDKKAARTGNVAVEYRTRKSGQKIPSGVSITEADFWAVEYDEECWLMVPTSHVKRLARLAIEQGRTQWIGDGGNHQNALVPIEWFVRRPHAVGQQ